MSGLRRSALAADAERALGRDFAGRCIGRDEDDIALVYKQHAANLPLPLPELLIACRTGQDMVRAFEFVRDRGLSFSVRSGGHCFADLSNRGEVILDCAGMNGVAIDADRKIVAGPGALSGDAIATLAKADMTLPVGGCPLVALGGLSLVGGFGLTGRSRGLLADRVSAAHVLLADGRLLECSANRHDDLFWALFGAGPLGFGIVTQLQFDPAPPRPGIAVDGAWPIRYAKEIFALWQDYAPVADPASSVQISLVAPENPDDDCFVRCYGVILDKDQSDGDGRDALLAGLAKHFGPFASRIEIAAKSAEDMPLYACGARTYRGEPAWLPSRPYTGTALLAQRSQFFDAPLPGDAIAGLIERLQADRTELQAREIECIPWGGNYARPDAQNCFSHRQAHMLLRYNSLTGRQPAPAVRTSMQNWVDACRDILRPYANGRIYAGYAEKDLPDPMASYFGEAAARLSALKRHYDPDNIFMGSVSALDR
ncbi:MULTISPECIES: FAD-binding oxidoreductase [unclassified Sphingopyxis]|uniref:FAD-binding oxidoreductase n=1 Tax=unclassified Sphingopyxis TaxID=2614943 RepID=UPI0007363061|nr:MULTISPECIES: FAD-binding oxidoreductase [unclassified Sphingopyxis]KTE38577.1 hypothetical protein ATE62_10715 [Sphingopyxis sp. HIX]KTE83888.1 hypothetical protein ATE72_11630 [Sphingopyxis sp. HXXIV]